MGLVHYNYCGFENPVPVFVHMGLVHHMEGESPLVRTHTLCMNVCMHYIFHHGNGSHFEA